MRPMTKSLKTARQKNGLTQQQLADRVGVTRWWINRIELGERQASPQVAKKIHSALSNYIKLSDLRPDIWGVE
jgi:transcriptional regulator with XRE-family HTH domain